MTKLVDFASVLLCAAVLAVGLACEWFFPALDWSCRAIGRPVDWDGEDA